MRFPRVSRLLGPLRKASRRVSARQTRVAAPHPRLTSVPRHQEFRVSTLQPERLRHKASSTTSGRLHCTARLTVFDAVPPELRTTLAVPLTPVGTVTAVWYRPAKPGEAIDRK